MKKILVLVMLSLTAGTAVAQQDPLYAQYLNNPFVLNPAYTGLTNNLNISASYRQQWTGIEGNPTTLNINGHISLLDNMGAGLMVISDKIGVTAVNEIYASYAYRIPVASDKWLSFGLQGGMINFRTRNTELAVLHPNDPIFSGDISESKPGIGAGVILTGEKFFIGLSVPRMLKTKSSAGGLDATLYTQHLYTMASYLFDINEHFRFKPSVLAKVVKGAPASVDVNAAAILNERYTVGLLTRNFTTYGVFLQALIKDTFFMGYTMEIPTSNSVGSSFSTHEITLGLRLNVLQSHQNGISNF